MLSWLAAGVTGFFLVELGPHEAPRRSKHEFLLERLCVLVLSEASLVCG